MQPYVQTLLLKENYRLTPYRLPEEKKIAPNDPRKAIGSLPAELSRVMRKGIKSRVSIDLTWQISDDVSNFNSCIMSPGE
ncbi:hypothetical protein NPIL_291131 [Nephila pilipes]|uniref:Uncharacterized protein n=1 Tax=Nephila pilipes TaxID=299642 RepID=A0A8X6P1X1_NEPPI|nr:hypothetical protein NPIL_291131 [Nephila pilipes]